MGGLFCPDRSPDACWPEISKSVFGPLLEAAAGNGKGIGCMADNPLRSQDSWGGMGGARGIVGGGVTLVFFGAVLAMIAILVNTSRLIRT